MSRVTEEPTVTRCASEGVSWLETGRPGLTELHATAAPSSTLDLSPVEQARQAYLALTRWASERGAIIVAERVFCTLAHANAIAAARSECCLPGAGSWPVTYLEGGPVIGEGLAGVQITAVANAATRPVKTAEGIEGVRVTIGGMDLLYLAGMTIRDAGEGLAEATYGMFHKASTALDALGAGYADVVRTWIYLRDILSWYDEFNEGRTRFYRGLVPPHADHPWPPASTGIEVSPQGDAWGAMDLLAVTGPGRSETTIEAIQSPAQRSPEVYGSCFSRASVLEFGGVATMYVSGTASIDLAGQSVYLDDLEAQTEFTLANVEALLMFKGMSRSSFLPSTLFVKPGCDPARARAVVENWDPLAAQGIWVKADVCRGDLLFEVDGVSAVAC